LQEEVKIILTVIELEVAHKIGFVRS